ncbi:MAG: DUF2119 domain-containing protein [Methanobrevibacter sp.]|uniref:DUF2119 domain-containing protein n=1 Tax=Methanobrevibacter sp. TaxID=66852 RepID=UPI0026DFBD32|nr:DUF2119 domain-containing protein [Methanobrevibacter sp.]MDO5848555.1 DUF2119 domain-containing protein [Methanobrevibacter sp.]
MAYFRYIDNGEGPTKLFIGGLHGNEGRTAIKFLKSLKKSDFSNGQIYIYNFDKTKYISTIDSRYYESDIGKRVLGLIEEIKPDFYIELHCYNIKNFEKLTSMERFDETGVPPLLDLGSYVLLSSVSPLIRTKYFSRKVICQTLEFPCLDKLNSEVCEEYGFDLKESMEVYNKILKMLAIAPSRAYYEKEIMKDYLEQAKLAIKYAKLIFGKNFPPY